MQRTAAAGAPNPGDWRGVRSLLEGLTSSAPTALILLFTQCRLVVDLDLLERADNHWADQTSAIEKAPGTFLAAACPEAIIRRPGLSHSSPCFGETVRKAIHPRFLRYNSIRSPRTDTCCQVPKAPAMQAYFQHLTHGFTTNF